LQAQFATGGVALGACPQAFAAVPDPVETGSTEPELPATKVAATAQPESTAAEFSPASARDIALKSAGGLIAGTFDALVVEDMGSDDAAPSEAEVTAVAEVESAALEAGGASEIKATPPLALAKRTVTSVPVGSDGQPQWPLTARAVEVETAAAGAAREVATADTPDIEPLAFAAAPETIAPEPHARPVTLVPAPDQTPVGRVAVGGSAVNVRSGPSGGDARLFVLPAGADVQATHAQKGWVRIVDEQGRDGWVYSDYLVNVDLDALPAPEPGSVQVASAAEVAPVSSSDIRTVLGQGVNVRSGPSSSSGKLFALRGGVKVTVSSEDGGWLKVTDPDGRTGWAYQQFLTGS
jgi:SH3-like domain-containing protein